MSAHVLLNLLNIHKKNGVKCNFSVLFISFIKNDVHILASTLFHFHPSNNKSY